MNDPVSNDAAIGKRTRRRRTWYRRRLRMRRTLIAVVVGTVVVGACWQNAANYFSSHSWRDAQVWPDPLWIRGNVRKNLAMAAQSGKPNKFLTRIPGVYPYSVVPGGVKDPQELREAALRDYVVRRHFAHFDFAHAQLIRSTEPREVYLSYRIRNTVFWTRKKVRLLPGELLLTDGKITARARCGNQISDTAKPEVSDEEPEEDVMDQPVAVAAAAPSFPIRALLNPPELPVGAINPPQNFTGGGFVFPPVPVGLPFPYGSCAAGETEIDGHCKHKHHHKGGESPEPSTMLLLGSGMVLILWRYRKFSRPVTA
ncbi:MAG: PEP-CTERM sorting domain-containing protein [Terriglobales bacterium]